MSNKRPCPLFEVMTGFLRDKTMYDNLCISPWMKNKITPVGENHWLKCLLCQPTDED